MTDRFLDDEPERDPDGFSGGEETGEPEPLRLVDPDESPFQVPDGDMLVEGEDLSDWRR